MQNVLLVSSLLVLVVVLILRTPLYTNGDEHIQPDGPLISVN